METSNVLELCKLSHYRTQRTHLFSTQTALEWFVRKHKPELVRAGALLLHCGQWHANQRAFDAFVVQAGAAAAACKVSA
jgi:hypothetical protein